MSDDEQWSNVHVEIANDVLRCAFPEGISSVHRVYGRLESEEEVNARFDRCDAEMAELNRQWRKEDDERIVKATVKATREMKWARHSKEPRRTNMQFGYYGERLIVDSDKDDAKPLYDMRVECNLAEDADDE